VQAAARLLDRAHDREAPAAGTVDDIVRELQALDVVLDGDGGAGGRAQQHRVVGETVAAVAVAGPVAADARDASGAGGGLHEHVADHLRVLAHQPRRLAVRPYEVQLVVERALDPVVVDLVAARARLHAVAAVRVVDPGEAQAERRLGEQGVVGRHVDLVELGAAPAVVHLDELERHVARLAVGAQDAVSRTVVHDRVGHQQVVALEEQAAVRAAGEVEALEDVVVGVQLDAVAAAADARAVAVDAQPADPDLLGRGPVVLQQDPARVGHVAVHLHHVARPQQARDRLQAGERLGGSDLVQRARVHGDGEQEREEERALHRARGAIGESKLNPVAGSSATALPASAP
jgi:hypothetical protein